MAIQKRKGDLDKIKPLVEKCRLYLTKGFFSAFHLQKKNLTNQDEFKAYLERTFHGEGNKAFVERILEIYRIKMELRKKWDYTDLINRINIVLEREEKDLERNFFISKYLLKKIEGFPPSFMGKLLELAVALKVGNNGWAKSSAWWLISRDRREYPFEMQNHFFPGREEEDGFREKLMKALQLMKKDFPDEKLYKMLITFWTELLPEAEREKVRGEWGLQWSLEEIREMAKSPYDGVLLPSLWFPLFIQKGALEEAKSLLPPSLGKDDETEEGGPAGFGLWWVPFIFPQEDLWRLRIKNRVRALKSQEGLYEQNLLLDLLEIEALKTLVEKEENDLKKPLFMLKRNFYWKLLKSGTNTDYAVYQLVKLGDLDQEFLWWVLL